LRLKIYIKSGNKICYSIRANVADGWKNKSAFQKDSKNLNIRNGVGILSNGDLIFAMSKKEVSFYKLAQLSKKQDVKMFYN
jgi:uncharacterized protein YigE (DUF2233 family)